MARKTTIAAGISGCCLLAVVCGQAPAERRRAIPPLCGVRVHPVVCQYPPGVPLLFPVATPPRYVAPVSALPAQAVTGPHSGGFAPVPIRDLCRPLPDNEVWVVKGLLLNPLRGSLSDPGAWAAPAKLRRGNVHWK